MIEDWEVKKLGDVCDYQNGFAFKSKTYKESGTPVIRITNIQNERLDLSKIVHINRDDYDKDLRRYEIVEGDLLIAMSGATTGKIGLVETDDRFLLNQRVGKFEPKEDLDKRYLFYYLTNKVEESLAISAGSAQPNLSTTQIKGFKIPLPPLPEQKRIVAILDEAFAALDRAKANIEQNIQNAEELFQSKLNGIFSERGEGWEEKKIGDVCSVLNGHAFKSKEAIDESNTQLLRMGNLYQNKLDLERKPVFYPDLYVREYQKYLLNESDLIMSLTGTVDKTDYGYTVELLETDVNLLLNQRIMKIIIDKPGIINKGFLKNYLLSPFFLEKLYATASGTRQANLSSRKIMKLPVFFPNNIDTQKKIVNEVQSLKGYSNSLLRTYKAKRESIEELKKSILQQAFSGQLTGEGDHRVVAGSSS